MVYALCVEVMEMTKNSIFSDFINKKVKIMHDDGGKIHFARGTVVKADDKFIVLKGDFSDQLIRIDTIIKINHMKNGGNDYERNTA